MIEYYGSWEGQEKMKFRVGRYKRMDFFGPFCDFEVRDYGKGEIQVFPIYVQFTDAENAIGDYNLVLLMCKDFFNEFGPFRMNIPKRHTFIDVTSEDATEELDKVLKRVPLI